MANLYDDGTRPKSADQPNRSSPIWPRAKAAGEAHAVASSYFGHALGTIEGTQYLFNLAAPKATKKMRIQA